MYHSVPPGVLCRVVPAVTSSCCPPAGIQCSVIAAASVHSSGAGCQQHTLSTGDCDLSGISVSLLLTSSPPFVKYKCGWKSNLTDELLKKRNNLKHLKTSFLIVLNLSFLKHHRYRYIYQYNI